VAANRRVGHHRRRAPVLVAVWTWCTRPGRAINGTFPTLRLFSANVHDANPDVRRIAEEILAATLDLVTLQEVDPDEVAGLRRSGILRHFPYKVTEIPQGASGIALWWFPSPRQRWSTFEVRRSSGSRSSFGIRQLRLYTVHMVAPLGDDRVRWRDQLRHLHEAPAMSMDHWWLPATSTPPAIIQAFGGSFRTGWRTPTSGAGRDGRRPGHGTDGCCHP